MKRFIILIATFSLLFFSIRGTPTLAQTTSSTDNHTAREEAEGKEIWDKLQSKQLECKNLTGDNYASLGEYFMGQSIGNTERHAAMNQMMTSMMGEEGEKQMHIIMGKKLSGCNSNAQIPSGSFGFMPMIWMMGSAGSPQVGGGGNPMMGTGWGNMMSGWGGFSILGWLFMLIFWILLILGVIALIRYLGGSRKRSGEDKPASRASRLPSDILKERYARGEVSKKEFEEMKKDLR